MAGTLSVQKIQGLASSATPTTVEISSGHVLNAPGHVIQTLQAVKTDTTSSTSTDFVDISGLSIAITPSSTSSKVLIICNFCWAGANNSSPKFRLAGGNLSLIHI